MVWQQIYDSGEFLWLPWSFFAFSRYHTSVTGVKSIKYISLLHATVVLTHALTRLYLSLYTILILIISQHQPLSNQHDDPPY